MEFNSAIKKKKMLFFVTSWMNLENFMLSEITPFRERQITYDFTHMWNLMRKLNKQGKWRQTHRWRAG